MKAGEIVTVEGVDYYAVPNLPQILIGDSSCVGCVFENSPASCAGTPCGSATAPKDEQVLLVRRPDNGTEDEGRPKI